MNSNKSLSLTFTIILSTRLLFTNWNGNSCWVWHINPPSLNNYRHLLVRRYYSTCLLQLCLFPLDGRLYSLSYICVSYKTPHWWFSEICLQRLYHWLLNQKILLYNTELLLTEKKMWGSLMKMHNLIYNFLYLYCFSTENNTVANNVIFYHHTVGFSRVYCT